MPSLTTDGTGGLKTQVSLILMSEFNAQGSVYHLYHRLHYLVQAVA